MEVKEIVDKFEWENFFSDIKEKTFLQSWAWGVFQTSQKSKIWRFGIYENNLLIGAALVTKISARRGTFLFIPHGPIFKSNTKDGLEALLSDLKELAEKEAASFIRISPFSDRTDKNVDMFKDLGFRQAPIHMHAEVTWELDITKPEDVLLSEMRKTTRYLIRQAQKNSEIEIIKSKNIGDLEQFNPVYLETARRHKFVVFSLKYLKNQLSAFLPDDQIMFFLGKYKGEVVSAAIFVFWQGGAFYHHSGSLSKYNKIPVSYLLQWEAIREAKNRGCKLYNFWGIAPDVEKVEDVSGSRHPWAGLTLFKMGFGGFRRDLVKTQDFIISRRYWINYLVELFRKLKRGL